LVKVEKIVGGIENDYLSFGIIHQNSMHFTKKNALPWGRRLVLIKEI
jgi:hypothetical protein